MTDKDTLVERHILEYQARLKHIDELFEHIETASTERLQEEDVDSELSKLRKEREQLLAHIDDIKRKTREDWQEDTIEQAGPMVLWEAVAKRLEKLVEHISR